MGRILKKCPILLLAAALLAHQYACTAQNSGGVDETTEELSLDQSVLPLTGTEPEPEPEPVQKTPTEEDVLKKFADGIQSSLERVQGPLPLFQAADPLDFVNLRIEDNEQILRLISYIIIADPQVKFLRYHIFGNNYGGGLLQGAQASFYQLLTDPSEANYTDFRAKLANLKDSLNIFKRLLIQDLKLFGIEPLEKINEPLDPTSRQNQFVADSINYLDDSPDPGFFETPITGQVPKEILRDLFGQLFSATTLTLTPETRFFLTLFQTPGFDFRVLHDAIIPYYFYPSND